MPVENGNDQKGHNRARFTYFAREVNLTPFFKRPALNPLSSERIFALDHLVRIEICREVRFSTSLIDPIKTLFNSCVVAQHLTFAKSVVC